MSFVDSILKKRSKNSHYKEASYQESKRDSRNCICEGKPLKVLWYKLYNNKHIIALTQITKTVIYAFFIWILYIQTNRTKYLQSPAALNIQETPGYKQEEIVKTNNVN